MPTEEEFKKLKEEVRETRKLLENSLMGGGRASRVRGPQHHEEDAYRCSEVPEAPGSHGEGRPRPRPHRGVQLRLLLLHAAKWSQRPEQRREGHTLVREQVREEQLAWRLRAPYVH